jgi:hypothetical protein
MERSLRTIAARRKSVESQALIIVVAAAVLVLIAVGVYAYTTRRRRDQLRERFGPEYDRTLERAASPAQADAILAERVERVGKFSLHPLSREQAESFGREWRRIQARFVDNPDAAVAEADQLVARVMAARGYPTEDFERLADDVSVEHPHVVENYRVARQLMARRATGDIGTEELRQAVVNYRALFDDLLQTAAHHHQRRAS